MLFFTQIPAGKVLGDHYYTLDQKFYIFKAIEQQFVLLRINSADNTSQPLLEMQAEHVRGVTRLAFGVPETDNIFEVC